MTPRQLAVYPPLPPGVWLRRPTRALPFPLDQPGHAVFLQARRGLLEALRALGLGSGEELLMPAYHHGSEVETVGRAGLTCRFYDVAPSVEPTEEQLDRLLTPKTRGLYLVHNLGLPQDARRWRRWCDARGLLLVEDAAQSWLAASEGHPVGSHADIAIFCLYKAFGLPDGGAVIARGASLRTPSRRPLGAATLLRRHADWAGQRSARFARRHGDVVEVPERDFAVGDDAIAASAATRLVLGRAVDARAPARRRANYERLRERLAAHLAPQLPALSEGAAPLAFPVLTRRKPALLAHLRDRGVVQGRMWETPHPSLDVRRFPGAAALREGLVGLPVHQELSGRDMGRIADVAVMQLEA